MVVAIAGLMAGISLPALSTGLDNLRLTQASDEVASFLNGAVNRAERKEQVIEVTVSPKENMMGLRSTEPGFVRKLSLPDGIVIDAVLPKLSSENGEPRRFLLLPGATAPRFGIQIVNKRGSRRVISLDPITGVPQIERPASQ